MSEDLAFHEGPVSELFLWPKTPNDWELFSLDDSQVEHYRHQG